MIILPTEIGSSVEGDDAAIYNRRRLYNRPGATSSRRFPGPTIDLPLRVHARAFMARSSHAKLRDSGTLGHPRTPRPSQAF